MLETQVQFKTQVRKIPWRREWLLTPVFLPRKMPWTEEPGGYSPWGCEELETTERPGMYTHIYTCAHAHTHTHTHIYTYNGMLLSH